MSGGSARRDGLCGGPPGARQPDDPVRDGLRRAGRVLRADGQAEEETYRSMIRVGWAKEDADLPAGLHEPVHPRRDRGAARAGSTTSSGCRHRRRTPSPAGSRARRSTSVAEIRDDPDADARPPGGRRPVDDVRQRGRVSAADPRRAPRADAEPQPHPPRRRAGMARLRRRGRRPSSSPTDAPGPSAAARPAGRGALAAGAEVLRLCADGLTNEEIATALTLSPRTVERHLSNVYLKLGLTGTAARAGAVARYLRGADGRSPTRLRVGRHRRRERRPRLRAGAVPVGRRARPTVASRPPTTGADRTEDPTDAHDDDRRDRGALPRRSRGRALDARPSRATLANGRARLSAGPFNWDADLPAALGGENLAPSPTAYLLGALAGCARRVPARHARARNSRSRSTTSRAVACGLGRRARPARHRRCRAGPRRPRPRHPRSRRSSPAERIDAMLAAWQRALPDLPRAAQAERVALTVTVGAKNASRIIV